MLTGKWRSPLSSLSQIAAWAERQNLASADFFFLLTENETIEFPFELHRGCGNLHQFGDRLSDIFDAYVAEFGPMTLED